MSVHRYVNSAFWDTDGWTVELRPLERYVFLYLLTNSKTSIAGVYELPMRTMSIETGLQAEDLEKILNKFQAEKKVYRFEAWIVLPNFPRHQKWEERSKIRQGIEAVLRKLPPWLFAKLKTIPYTYPMDRICIGQVYHPNGSPPESESESELELESETEGECEGERQDTLSVSHAYPTDTLSAPAPDGRAPDGAPPGARAPTTGAGGPPTRQGQIEAALSGLPWDREAANKDLARRDAKKAAGRGMRPPKPHPSPAADPDGQVPVF